MSHLDPIAKECFLEEAWQKSPKAGMGTVMMTNYLIMHAAMFLTAPIDYWDWGIGIATGVSFAFITVYLDYPIKLNTLVSLIIAAFTSRPYVSRNMKAYHRRDTDVVIRVCKFAVHEFRDQIASERERALDDDSDWSRKRGDVAGAADGAREAADYWTERTRQEPGSRKVKERLDAATALCEKLESALAALDQRAQTIRTAFDQCHDKVDAMERRVGDVDKIRQLGTFSDSEGGGQALAAASVKEIAEELFEEAQSVGAALERLSKLEVATAPRPSGDNVEQLAEETVVESERVSKAIADLDLAPQVEQAIDIGPGQPDQAPERQPAPVEVAEPAPPPVPEPPTPIRPVRPRPTLFEPLERPRPPARPTTPATPARMSDAEEERQMKDLVARLRRMAEVQERKAHDLRFRDDGNSEAYDREDLAEKKTELADEIEMFFAVNERMKDWRAQNP